MVDRTCCLFWLLPWVIFLPKCSVGQDPRPQVNFLEKINGRFPTTQTHDIFQDQDGFMCMVSITGILRFDGSQYRDVSNDSVSDFQFIYADPQPSGKCLLRTWHGYMAWYDRGELRPYPFNDSIPKHLSRSIISIYVDQEERLHFGTKKDGYWTVSSEGKLAQQKVHGLESGAYLIQETEDGSPLIIRNGNGAGDGKLYQLDREGKAHFVTQMWDDQFEFVMKSVRPICIRLQNGDFLFSKDRILLTIRDGKVVGRRELDYSIYNLLEDSEGGIWVSTHHGGARYIPDLDADGEQVFFEGEIAGVMAEDAQNGIWITVMNKGVYHLPDRWYTFHTKQQGVLDDDFIRAFEHVGDAVFVITRSGKVFAASEDSLWEVRLPIYPATSMDYDAATGECWFTGEGLVQRFKDEAWEVFYLPDEFRKAQFYHTFIWKGGDGIGLLTKNRVIHFRDGKVVSQWKLPTYGYAVNVGFEESIWIGAEDGLYRLTEGEWINVKDQYPELDARIVGLAQQGDRLWISMEDDLVVLEHEELTRLHDVDDNRLGNATDFVFLGDTALFYGKHGLFKVWLTPQSDTSYYAKQLLPSNKHMSTRFAVPMRKLGDQLLLGGVNGLARLDLNRVAQFEPALPISHVLNVQINGRDTTVRPNYVLAHDQNFVQFAFTAIGFRNNEGTFYQYRLKGIDQDWKSTESNTIQYANLDAGTYTFELKSMVRFTPQFGGPTQITFIIQPPYWETWWFRSLVGLSVFGALIGGFFIRINRLRKQAQMQQALNQSRHQALNARMSPHFIFNALNSIQRYVAENDEVSSTRYVARFSKLMRQILEHSGQLTVSLEEELDAIRNYLELEQMRMKGKMTYEIVVDSTIDAQQVFVPTMMIQPHVENAVWHGVRHREDGCGKIHIGISQEGDQMLCVVKDNGVGYRQSAQKAESRDHKPIGTTITKNRMRLISSMFKVKLDVDIQHLEQEPDGVGTLVKISFPKTLQVNDAI